MKLKELMWDNPKDLAHYVILYSILLASWVPVMNYFQSQVVPTALVGFIIFMVSDKLLHKLLRV